MPDMARLHPLTVASMVLPLLGGLLLALGHHLFYSSLINTPISDEGYKLFGSSYPSQQINTAVGTTFAFLTKAAFVLSVSTAYVQVFWQRIKKDASTDRPPTLERVDTAYSGLTNIVSLCTFSTWYKYPGLLVIVATAWLIPIASIFTPATLSVSLRENITSVSMQNVPQLDFFSLNYVAGMPETWTGTQEYTYSGPSQAVRKIAMSASAGRAILPIPPPFANSSWSLEFHAPSLKCDLLSDDDSLGFRKNIAAYLLQDTNSCYSPSAYLAWYPKADRNLTKTGPYTESKDGKLEFGDPETVFSYTKNSDERMSLPEQVYFVLAIMPHVLQVRLDTGSLRGHMCPIGPQSGEASTSPLAPFDANATMMSCRLHNSTYHTEFQYLNWVQTVKFNITELGSVVPLVKRVQFRPQGAPGRTVAGSTNNCTTLSMVGRNTEECLLDTGIIPQLSYAGILQAFTTLFTGRIGMKDGDDYTISDSTAIRSTALMDTEEMKPFTDYQFHMESGEKSYYKRPDLQRQLLNYDMADFSGLPNLGGTYGTQRFQDALEIMFQNYTISLLSSSKFWPNHSSSTAPAKVAVTQYTAQTVYTYSAGTLWLAYGVAALATLACVAAGLAAIVTSGVSYSTAFSTVLRISQAAELSVEVQQEDLDGKSPLPKYMAKATVRFRSEAAETDEGQDSAGGKAVPGVGTALLA